MGLDRHVRKTGRTVRSLVLGVTAFILASIAFWSFQEAVYKPLVELITRILGKGLQTHLFLLVVCSLILVYVLKRQLPFTR